MAQLIESSGRNRSTPPADLKSPTTCDILKKIGLPVKGINHFHVISHKLMSHVSFTLIKDSSSSSEIDEFISGFLALFVTSAKEAIKSDLVKLSKTIKLQSTLLTGGQCYGLIGISFSIARSMIHVKEFEKALKYSKAVVSNLGALCLDTEILDAWTKALIVYAKCSALTLLSSKKPYINKVVNKLWDTASLYETGQDLRDVRKKIYSSKFEKKYTEGYDYALLYILMDSIGRALQPGSVKEISCTALPICPFTQLIREAYSLEEACNKLRIKREEVFVEISLSKAWDKQVTFVFIVMRLICDRMYERELEINEDICIVGEYCYCTLLSLVDKMSAIEEKKISEVYARLTQYSCNIGFGLHKRKSFQNAFNWSTRAMDCYNLLKSCGNHTEIKMNTLSMSLLSAECLRNTGEAEEGLRCLAKWIHSEPLRLDTPSMTYDIFEQIPWSDWNTHWIQTHIDAQKKDPSFSKSIIDLIEEDDPGSLTEENISKALRFELNSYFTGRQVLPQGIINTSVALLVRCIDPQDNLMGMLGRSIGFFWGDLEQINLAYEITQQAIQFIEEEEIFVDSSNLENTIFISALISAWRGIIIHRKSQYFVEAEMDILKQQLISEKPEKYKDRDTGEERGVSGFSSLNYGHEMEWTTCLIRATDILYRFAQSEELLKGFCEKNCPALVLVTCRIIASLLKSVGDPVNAVKAWNVLNQLSKIYDRKGLQVLSASEILKVIPDLEMKLVKEAEEANRLAIENKTIKHSRAISYRIHLAKSVACLHNEQFTQGILHLLKVFEFFDEKDNFDSSHHLLGEATSVFSMYRHVEYSQKLDLSKFPQSLRQMSPTGLATKGYKLLCGLTRDPETEISGWTDLFHNYYLVGSLMDLGAYAMKLLKDSGKIRDLKCFTSDAVHFSQHFGLVSRSIALIVPLIDLDIDARNFYQAQMKIDVINEIFSSSKCPQVEEIAKEDEYQKLMNNLKLPKLNVERLESVSDLKWGLKHLDISSVYYRNRSEKCISTLKKDLKEGFDKREFCIPEYVQHHYSCFCYVCTHPTILPITFQFLFIQARYLSCMTKYKHAMAVLETTKLFQERSVFRLIYNLSFLTMPLSLMSSKIGAAKAIDVIYTPFTIQPGLQALYNQMVICPAADLKMILNAMKKVVQIKDAVEPKDYLGKIISIDHGLAAIYRHFKPFDVIKIIDAEIREKLQAKLESYEKENKFNARSVTPPLLNHETNAPPAPRVPKKGILNNATKKRKGKVDSSNKSNTIMSEPDNIE